VNIGMLEKVELTISGTPDPHLKQTFTYDARDEIDTITNARNFTANLDFDDAGRIERFENALGEVTHFRYRGPSDLVTNFAQAPPGFYLSEIEAGTTTADGEGQVRRLRYDAEGRLRRIERKDVQGRDLLRVKRTPSFPHLPQSRTSGILIFRAAAARRSSYVARRTSRR
jgi:YD repeat-containing protein